jgi:hypothetical protein
MADKTLTRWLWEPNAYDKTWAEVRGTAGLDEDQRQAIVSGTPVAAPLPKLRIEEVTPGAHPDLLLHPSYRIASERLTELIVATGARLQLLPVVFPARRKHSRVEYQLVNLLERADALDEDASKIMRWPDGTIRAVRKLVLRPPAPGTPGLFRISALPTVWVADETLRRAVEETCTGAGRFLPADKFKFG